jgi:hypothetical protein
VSGDLTRVVAWATDGDVGDPLAIRVAACFSIVWSQAREDGAHDGSPPVSVRVLRVVGLLSAGLRRDDHAAVQQTLCDADCSSGKVVAPRRCSRF